MNKYCFSFNDPSIYREAIYKLMDESYDCDWYFDELDSSLKSFDVRELQHVYELKRVNIGPFYWVKGLLPLLWKGYKVYLMRGATRNLSSFVFLILKKIFFPQKKVIFWTHGFYGKESKLETLLFKKPLFMLADRNLCYGNYARDIMINKGFSPERVHVIYNSLNYSIQYALRNKMELNGIFRDHFSNASPVIVMIGRLNMRKKLDYLLYAVKQLKEQGEDYNLVLIGSGEHQDQLQTLCAMLDIMNQVWFYGPCFDEYQNANLLYNADICVVPGDIGLTAIHAMMFGCPCISHNCFSTQGPEFEAIKPGITGDFYENGNIGSLSFKISNWFKQHQNFREEVRKECYKEIDTLWNPQNQITILKQYL